MNLRVGGSKTMNGVYVCGVCLKGFSRGSMYLSGYQATVIDSYGWPKSDIDHRCGAFHQECVAVSGNGAPAQTLTSMMEMMVRLHDEDPKMLNRLYRFMYEGLNCRI